MRWLLERLGLIIIAPLKSESREAAGRDRRPFVVGCEVRAEQRVYMLTFSSAANWDSPPIYA